MSSVDIAYTQLYRVEPIDPWPSVAVGWFDRGEPYRAVLAPCSHADAEEFARRVEDLVMRRAPEASRVLGWLAVPVVPWEPVEAMPSERRKGPLMGDYRLAPEQPDPLIARRAGRPSLRTLVHLLRARFGHTRGVVPAEVELTRRFLYVRTYGRKVSRIPSDRLRTMWRVGSSASVYVFGRNTELILVDVKECPVARALQERLPVRA